MSEADQRDVLHAFGAAIRASRLERGWSQEAFADHVGLHRTYVGDIERGERNVGLLNVDRLAAALEVPLSVLMAEVERIRSS